MALAASAADALPLPIEGRGGPLMGAVLVALLGVVLGAVVVAVAWWMHDRRRRAHFARFLDEARRALIDGVWPPAPEWPAEMQPLQPAVMAFRAHHHGVERTLAEALADATAQRDAAQRAEAEFSEFIDRLALGFTAFDRALRYRFVNRAVERYFNKPRSEIIGRSPQEAIDAPALHDHNRPYYLAALNDNTSSTFEVFDAERGRWLQHQVYPSATGISAIIADITERKEAQDALAAARDAAESARQQLQAILDRITDGFVALDTEWRCTYVNARGAQILGKPREALVGRILWQDYGAVWSVEMRRSFVAALRDGTPAVWKASFPTAGLHLEHYIYPSANGVSVFIHDVTEANQAREELDAANLRLQLAVNASSIGYWEWDLGADTIWLRFSAPRRAVIPMDEYQGPASAWLHRIHPEDLPRILAARDAHIATGSPSFEVEFRTFEEDGTWHWTFASAAAVRSPQGTATRLVGMHLDITKRKALEEELRASRDQLRGLAASQESARESERKRLSREIHDELGQAMAVLHMDATWQLQHLEDAAAARRERLDGMRRLIANTAQSVRRLAAELRPGVLDDLGLAAGATWLANEFTARSGLEVSSRIDELPPLSPDASTAIFRILQESLTNIAKHAEASTVQIALEVREGCVELQVTDDGRGMAASQPGRRVSFGLLGMQERASAWGGTVEVANGAPRGTVVRARFPLARVAREGGTGTPGW